MQPAGSQPGHTPDVHGAQDLLVGDRIHPLTTQHGAELLKGSSSPARARSLQAHSQGIHQMYMEPRFSLSVASLIRRSACPSTESGRLGMLLTPSSVPVRRPAHALSMS